MKILIITNHSYMHYRFRRELVDALLQDHEVVLSMPFVGHEDDFKAMGVRCIETKVDRRGINPKTDLKLLLAYRNLIRREKPDLVITYSIKPNIYAGLVCSWLKVPYCTNVQGLGSAFQRRLLAQFVTLLYRLALRKARVVFFENEANAGEFLRRRILSPEKIKVLPGAGINLEAFPLTPYPENQAVRFLYLGRIMKEKGIDELFSAMRRLHGELGAGVKLDLVGFFDDDCEELVKALVEEGIAEFHGFQTDTVPYYAAADCVVLPSYHEGMSNVLLEVAAIGRPVITSNIPGCREAMIPGVTGLLCEAHNTDSLYADMAKIAAMSREERAAMGRAGRRHMEEVFDRKKVVAQTLKALGMKPGADS